MNQADFLFCLTGLAYQKLIDDAIKARGIAGLSCAKPTGRWRLYAIPKSEVHKLPEDERGYYLGNAEVGVSLYELQDVEEYRSEGNFGEWRPI